MNRLYLLLVIGLSGISVAQSPRLVASASNGDARPSYLLPADIVAGNAQRPAPLDVAATLPRMTPELALQAYQRRWEMQSGTLASYSAKTLIRAELPETQQQGELKLDRYFAAPRTLVFKSVEFTGDKFVKNNVITRLLQSEVDHVQKDDTSLTALTLANYKFSSKGTSQVNGRTVHDFQVKPRKKRAGMFRGHVYLDAYTGSLVRVEGSVVKSPSFFIRKIDFIQDYADVGAFTFPIHMHSEALARMIGRAIVDIYQQDYRPETSVVQVAQQVTTP